MGAEGLEVSEVAIAALIVSIVAVVIAGWSALSNKRFRDKTWALAQPSMVVTWKVHWPPPERLHQWVYEITVTNQGGGPGGIVEWGISRPGFDAVETPLSKHFVSDEPGLIESHGHLSLYVDGSALISLCNEWRIKPETLYPWVKLTTGERIEGPNLGKGLPF
jgi:hypothetical protein